MSINKETQFKSSGPYNCRLSESVDKGTANILYNYGKSELKKDITVFGKHHLLSEDDTGMNDDFS